MFSSLYALIALGLAACGAVFATPIGNGTDSLSARQVHSGGIATYYLQGGAFGACGQIHSDQDHIVALQTVEYANGANCGRTISITDTQTGVTATGVVADLCPGCPGTQSIDLSQGLFEVFAPVGQGTFPVSWSYV